MALALDPRQVYRPVAYRPFGDKYYIPTLKIWRRQLPLKLCGYYKKGTSSGLALLVSVTEKPFGIGQGMPDPRAFVIPRCAQSKISPGQVENQAIGGDRYNILRADILLNRDLFGSWDADPAQPKWDALANRARWVAHEIHNVRRYFDYFCLHGGPPDSWGDYLDWGAASFPNLQRHIDRPLEADEDDLMCSRDSIRSTLDHFYYRNLGDNPGPIRTFRDFCNVEHKPLGKQFFKHWREEWVVPDWLIRKRIMQVLP